MWVARLHELDCLRRLVSDLDIFLTSDRSVSPDEFIDLLHRSTLAERRPVDDRVTIKGMLDNSNLLISAWQDEVLVGVARSMTDFHYACYLSDLAVDRSCQRQGIGKALLSATCVRLGEKCKLILVSAPAAEDYYPRLGFEKNDRTWVLPRGIELTG